MIDKYVIAASEKSGPEAIKDISLQIKNIFPRLVPPMFILFTPNYDPQTLIETLQYTLKPRNVTAISAPSLIYQTRILEKGVIACCVQKDDSVIKSMVFKHTDPIKIESSLRVFLKTVPGEKHAILAFLPPDSTPLAYARGVELALGKSFNVYGAGFTKRYSFNHTGIIDSQVLEGTMNMVTQNIKIVPLRITGFLPMGKPFVITRVVAKRGMIIEINDQPAVNIYKHFLQDKFDVLRKNRLFPYYPIGIKDHDETRLVSVISCLDDGSLACLGDVKEGSRAHIMMLHPSSLFESIQKTLTPLRNKGSGPVFIINSFTRKKILKTEAESELKAVSSSLGPNYSLFGLYSDYSLFPDIENREIGIEAGNLLLTFWQ